MEGGHVDEVLIVINFFLTLIFGFDLLKLYRVEPQIRESC